MRISIRWLAVLMMLCLLLSSGLALAQARVLPAPTGPERAVCYVVELTYLNTSATRQTVDAYVARWSDGTHTTATYSFSLDAGDSGVFRIVFLIPDPRVTWQFLAGSWPTNPSMKITAYFESYLDAEDCTGHLFGDGRINDGENERAAPVVAYCETDGIGVYDVDLNSQGTLVFRVAYDDIRAGLEQAQSSGVPVTLGSAGDDALYALPDGKLQVSGPEQVTGKRYDYVFAGDFCGK